MIDAATISLPVPPNSAIYSDTYSAALRAPNSARNRGR
jgi:hypothetical protein